MGSRKDLIKRSLGITEYPWSSDDDLEEAPLGDEETSHQRPPGEPRPSTADAPGSSALPPQQQQPLPQPPLPQQPLSQQQQMDQMQQMHQLQQQQLNEQQQQQHAMARRNQARMDRDLFWSIINSPQRIPMHRSRSSEIPVPYASRMNHIPAAELRERVHRPAAAEIQRILAFKRLTRNINSLRHRGHIIPVTRVNPGVIVPSEVNSGIRINRHVPIRRFVRAGPLGPPHHDTYDRERALHMPQHETRPGRHARAHAAGAEPVPAHAQPPPPPPPPPAQHHAQNIDEVNNNPIIPTEDNIGDDDENIEQDMPLEADIENDDAESDHSSPPAPMEEEIVTIDMEAPAQIVVDDEDEAHETRAGTSGAGDAPGPTEARFTHDYQRATDDNPMPSTSSTAVSDTEPQQQPTRGIKRRRRDYDSIDPCSVKEFNKNLLRLLECPVCLEWMEPPMSQCRRGHLVCVRCRARLASCPVCRTTFSSVRNRAMEGVAEMLRYPCRHGCGREVRLRRRGPHEASCAARKYQCPAPPCADGEPLPRNQLAHHFQSPVELPSNTSPEGSTEQGPPEPDVSEVVNMLPLSENDEETLLSPDPTIVENINADPPRIPVPLPDDPRLARAFQHYYDAMAAAPRGRILISLLNEPASDLEPLPQDDEHAQRVAYAARQVLPAHLTAPQGIAAPLPTQPISQVENLAQHASVQASRENLCDQAPLPSQHNNAATTVRNPNRLLIQLLNEGVPIRSDLDLVEPSRRQYVMELFQRYHNTVGNFRRQCALRTSVVNEVVQNVSRFDVVLQEQQEHLADTSPSDNTPDGVPINLPNQFRSPAEHHVDGGQPLPTEQPQGDAALQGPMQDPNNADERFLPPVPGGNLPGPEQPPLQEENGLAADNVALLHDEAIYNDSLNMAEQSRHQTMMKIGRRHRFSMKVNSEQHDNWLILALEEYFHLRIDVDVRTWGVVVYVSYIGPKCDARNFAYEVTIDGQHNQRKLVYSRATHSDLESSSLNVSRQDCFHLTLDQALNFIRFKNRHCDADRFLDFNVEIKKAEQPTMPREESDS